MPTLWACVWAFTDLKKSYPGLRTKILKLQKFLVLFRHFSMEYNIAQLVWKALGRCAAEGFIIDTPQSIRTGARREGDKEDHQQSRPIHCGQQRDVNTSQFFYRADSSLLYSNALQNFNSTFDSYKTNHLQELDTLPFVY